jgi:mannose/fructose/N-acetylgalactosamine-specific phosphotransferase system component IIC
VAAGRRDIEIVVGDDYSHVVYIGTRVSGVFTPTNITGRTYTSTVFKVISSPVATMTATVTNGAAGEVTITLADTVTADLIPDCYKWSLKQDASGVKSTILKGNATVKVE